MKRKIVIGFIVLTTIFTAGGIYISVSIDQVISELETIITLHQVEILRKTLLTDVKAVQQDFLLSDSPHAADFDAVVQHGEQMAEAAEGCFDCHHSESSKGQLASLRRGIHHYQTALSRVYTTSANVERMNRRKQIAFHIGQQIIYEINAIIESSSETLRDGTETALDDIAQTRRMLTLLVVAGPVIGLAIALYFIRYLTRSVAALINATRRLKAGELDHKVEGLSDEFGELGESVTEMALALKEMIRAIEENQKRYRMLFESAGDAIFILEAEGESVGRIVSANQAAADMHGYAVDELLKLNMQDLVTPEAAAESPERIRRMLNGEWIGAEVLHRKRDGAVFSVETSAGLLEFEDQKYILAFGKDITERKQAEEALQRTERLAVVGEIAAGLAHEIKNPLAGIKVSIEVLTRELQLAQEDEEVFQRIIDEINRIETLLKNLLSYAMPPTPQFTHLDVNKIIDATTKTAALSLRSPAQESRSGGVKDIRFVRDLGDQLPEVVVDAAQLQQVILNLLLNAVAAIHDSGSISVKTSADSEGFIEIVVSDTGKGIGEKDIDKIFLPFFTTKPKGTGLGLSICKRLIEQQNGTINAARNPAGGLVVTIKLPVEEEREIGCDDDQRKNLPAG
jgi:two-component system sensor histidine kinase AtoS